MPFLLEEEGHLAYLVRRGMLKALASILQAFLRTDRGIPLRPWGRRCLADHHWRTWCPPNKPPRVSSGLGNPGSSPGGAAHGYGVNAIARCAAPAPQRSASPAGPP